MNRFILAGAGLAISTFLAACGGPVSQDGLPLIAVPRDDGFLDSEHNRLVDGQAGIAYDPDGCQVWIIDDGAEGYSSRRVDPRTGLPVCNDAHPPGTIIGNHKTNTIPEFDGGG